MKVEAVFINSNALSIESLSTTSFTTVNVSARFAGSVASKTESRYLLIVPRTRLFSSNFVYSRVGR